ncbi:short-subunit dehydrogenase [Streptosporangium becharense]|uniref:Short-subunit dehydrogenase n=1 Tax=Streptosporangium becharense TaxID=1816182 RepID=A0A7W9IIU9_9ACTN|nr:SDR family NAD(P)-dependent oxidoreductase [Streptosporangium becharense]MBB2913816.1 short-subunit dehydrogenase [Streptosporangium becharense]MBB5821523.1 short-subunit dehydrogenase [Streptosporangium becharense]
MDTSSTKPLAVVTGASSGIGYELARQFAEHGFDLVIAAEDKDLIPAARSLEDLGATVSSVRVDLAHRDGVEEFHTRIMASGRPVNAVAINAGVGVGGDFARDTDLDDELRLIKLNVVSSVHLAKLVLPDMVRRGRGRLLFTSSVAGTMPGPFHAVYAASKAFLYSFSEAIREELKDTGVTVTALLPGPTDTDFFRRADMEDTKVGSGRKDDPAEVARQGFEALMSGDDHVVAGSKKNVLQSVAGKIMPETAKARAMRSMAEPGGAEPGDGESGGESDRE